eukprot:TRINITY_DN31067_c0_g1_i1.p1 TRINITY_DN31067_c0_g1~~TRINITY_DN31067_c0_g1_i1.p1  ORF type:complete len:543 (-),score=47.36 TRINITY_DN31067_c0_g1_i1:204-1763(-)
MRDASSSARWGVVLMVASYVVASSAINKPKHILAVIIDDLGFDDLGFRNQGQISTPNFNSLAHKGILLNNYYVQPSCSPTRATIMTGRKPIHTGINFWIPNSAYGLPLNETTLAQVLNARGFRSHAIGKWHLGFHKTAYTPTFRGFDSFYGYYEGSEDYFKHTTSGGLDLHHEEGQHCGHNCTTLLWSKQGVYSTTLYSDRAVDVISRHDASTPMFMYLAYQGVHEPRQSPQRYIDPYRLTIPDVGRREFAGMVSALDEGLGNVTAALHAKGMFDETLILVTTDNGGPTTECSTTGQSNWPYRGSKCSIWEGGTRGTAFMYWSGLPTASQGSTWMGLAHAADWLPTLVTAVGSEMRRGETLPLDGVDLWHSLLRLGSSPRTDVYYGISQDIFGPAVRDAEGNKLILGGGGGGKGQWSPQQLPGSLPEAVMLSSAPRQQRHEDALLFRLSDDEGERHNLTLAAHSKIVLHLSELIARYEATSVPQLQGDPSCPPFAPRQSTQGSWIGPWCDESEELVALV